MGIYRRSSYKAQVQIPVSSLVRNDTKGKDTILNCKHGNKLSQTYYESKFREMMCLCLAHSGLLNRSSLLSLLRGHRQGENGTDNVEW